MTTEAPARRSRMPRKKAKIAEDCIHCDLRIRPGQWLAKDFTYAVWVHVGCLIRRLNAAKEASCSS